MRKFFERFFMVLGVIFFILILAGAYIVLADPFGLRPIWSALTGGSPAPSASPAAAAQDKHSLLTPQQEQTLQKIGVDPASLPSTITPAMEACFTQKLGADRVAEIKAGSAPTPVDFFQAKSCL
jgi:hypothetical protein